MKTSEIASEYNIPEFDLNNHIKKHATFPFKEIFWGEITFSDDVDIETFIQPLLKEKEVRAQKIAEKKLRQQQEEHEQQLEEQKSSKLSTTGKKKYVSSKRNLYENKKKNNTICG